MEIPINPNEDDSNKHGVTDPMSPYCGGSKVGNLAVLRTFVRPLHSYQWPYKVVHPLQLPFKKRQYA
jgi:hypothetical protein